MFSIRRSNERGHFNHGWLNTYHTFSFDQYYDPRYMGFRSLRVINEDFVAPGRGFPKHGHRDMEIITYILEGALQHEDSMGNGSVIRPGDVQRMTAGTGVRHSEQNASRDEPVRFLQVWITPERRALPPGYEQKHYDLADKQGRLLLIGSPDGREGSITIHQDLCLFATVLAAGVQVQHRLGQERCAWVQVATGSVELDGRALGEGDGAAIVSQSALTLTGAGDGAEVLVFDLA